MERPISDMASLVNEILAFVRGPAQAMEIGDVERHLLSLVMAVGHIHMQVDSMFGFNLFNSLLGSIGGNIAWIAALTTTWVLTGLGFVSVFRAARVK